MPSIHLAQYSTDRLITGRCYVLLKKGQYLLELLGNVTPPFSVSTALVLNVCPEFAQAPTSADKTGQIVFDKGICRQPVSQALVFALIGSLASCPRHEDVLDGFEIFKELLDRIHGSPLLGGMTGSLGGIHINRYPQDRTTSRDTATDVASIAVTLIIITSVLEPGLAIRPRQ